MSPEIFYNGGYSPNDRRCHCLVSVSKAMGWYWKYYKSLQNRIKRRGDLER